MTGIPAMPSPRIEGDRVVTKLCIQVSACVEIWRRARRCAQQTMIIGSLMICRRRVGRSQFHPLNTAGGTNLHPAWLARGTERCPRWQRQLD